MDALAEAVVDGSASGSLEQTNVLGWLETRKLSRDDRIFEFMMNALRLHGGFDTPLFQERTGLPVDELRQQLDEAERQGLLVWDRHRIKPTVLGRRFLNDLLQLFLPAEPSVK